MKIFSAIGEKAGNCKRAISDFFYGIKVSVYRKFHKTEKPKKQNRRRAGERVFYVSVVLLPVIQFLIFYVLVNFNSIRLAFSTYDMQTDSYSFSGFDNFAYVIENFSQLNLNLSTKYSLLFYVFGLLIGTPLALFFSFYISKKMRGYGFFRIFLFFPQIISSIILVIIYTFLVEDAIPQIIYLISGERTEGVLTKAPFAAIVFYNIYMGFGSSVLLYSGAMSKIDESIVEASELDGITPIREFFSITMPLVFPTFSTFIVIGVAGVFINQHNLFSFFGEGAIDKGVSNVGYYIYVKVLGAKAASNDYGVLGALGLLFSCVSIPITYAIRYLLNKVDPNEV